ncbi:unnamed protein product [Phaedon cochleariae]|uniref:Uncharacterized protein n=1 Tax=Phaedon cochleariae TaxID=80249 RepID=A0A9N9SBA9_PHACE|nr:unnamed protein product [Phaedon cochleariae]
MAGVDGTAVSSLCKKCKSNVVSGYKCIECNSYFHHSCGKKRQVKVICDNNVICCEKTDDKVVENDAAFFDAVDEFSDSSKKIDVSIFNYVVKQKDTIICELRDKISLLNEQIILLNKIKAIENSSPNFILSEETKPEAKTWASVTADKKGKDNSSKQKINHQCESHTKTVKNSPQPIISKITKKDVSNSLAQVVTQTKMNEIINLTNNEKSPSNLNLDQDGWRETKRKRRRNVIIGKNSTEIVKGVPKYINLHVYRLKPGTTTDELTHLLKSNFPEVACESLNSKFPELYSSFKVTIMESHFRKAMDPSLWPFGACISRFLEKRKQEPQIG